MMKHTFIIPNKVAVLILFYTHQSFERQRQRQASMITFLSLMVHVKPYKATEIRALDSSFVLFLFVSCRLTQKSVRAMGLRAKSLIMNKTLPVDTVLSVNVRICCSLSILQD